MLWKALSRRMPALLITMSTRPKASSADFTIASPPFGCGDRVVAGDRLATGGGDLVDDGLCRSVRATLAVDRTAEVVDDDQRAALGEVEGVRATEAAAGAGDDRDLAVEPEICHAFNAPRPEGGIG